MDINEVVKNAPELVKAGVAVTSALKLSEATKAILGKATDEFAERIRDEVRLYRFSRQLEALKKAEKMATDAGFTPKAVPVKLLFPLLEGASLEEDEDLHTMWAALLANASHPKRGNGVRAAFAGMLREMSPDDAILAKHFYQDLLQKMLKGDAPAQPLGGVILGVEDEFIRNNFKTWGFVSTADSERPDYMRYYQSLDNLIRIRILSTDIRTRHFSEPPYGLTRWDAHLLMTGFDFDFVNTCSAPKAQA